MRDRGNGNERGQSDPTARAAALLADCPVVVRIPVQWGEMDAYGHVSNVTFFRWFESARVEYLIRCGFARSWEENGVGAILHSTGCRFRRPLFHPDVVLVGGRAVEVEEDRFTMEYRVVSESAGEVAAEGAGVVVSYDYRERRKVPIPEEVREGIESLEQRET
jgi:acyl-CoA thioester hydrolase